MLNEINLSLVDWSRAQFALTAAYHCSYIRLALNFYTAYEAAAEKKGFENDRISGLYDRRLPERTVRLRGR